MFPADAGRPGVCEKGLEVSLRNILEHRFIKFGFSEQLYEPAVFLLQFFQPIASSAFIQPY